MGEKEKNKNIHWRPQGVLGKISCVWRNRPTFWYTFQLTWRLLSLTPVLPWCIAHVLLSFHFKMQTFSSFSLPHYWYFFRLFQTYFVFFFFSPVCISNVSKSHRHSRTWRKKYHLGTIQTRFVVRHFCCWMNWKVFLFFFCLFFFVKLSSFCFWLEKWPQ